MLILPPNCDIFKSWIKAAVFFPHLCIAICGNLFEKISFIVDNLLRDEILYFSLFFLMSAVYLESVCVQKYPEHCINMNINLTLIGEGYGEYGSSW